MKIKTQFVEVLRRPDLDIGPCLEYQGCRNEKGYGRATRNRVSVYIHRYAYEQIHGKLAPGIDVLHRCDNPPCAQDSHLFEGTNLDNIRDSMNKGRRPMGERHHNARLAPTDIPAIRKLLAQHYSQREVAARFGVTQTAISAVATGRRWAHVG